MKISELKVAFIKSNRSVTKDDSNTKSKMKSIAKFKKILQPVTWVTVERATKQGLKVVDVDGKEITEGDYKVIIDGQHRIMAAIELSKLKKDSIVVDVPLVEYKGDDIIKWLSEVNVESTPWKGTDFVSGAASIKFDDDVVNFAMELKEKGFKMTQISWILTFKEKGIIQKDFVDVMNGNKVDWKKKGVNINTAKDYLNAMKEIEKKNYSGMFKAITYVCDQKKITIEEAIELIGKFDKAVINNINTRTNQNAAFYFRTMLGTEADRNYPNRVKKSKKK